MACGSNLETGWAMLDAGNFAAAIRTAKQSLQSDPNDYEAIYLLSRGALMIGDFHEADANTRKLLRLRPDGLEGHVNQVQIPMHRGLYQASKDALEQFKTACPTAVQEYLQLSAAWEHQFGSPTKAKALYREILSHNPSDPHTHMLLGFAEYDAQNPFAAEGPLRQVLQQKMTDARVLEVMAFIRFRQFAFSDARELAKGARQLRPDHKPVRWAIWGSSLALFPPFFIGHGLQWISANAAETFGPIAGHFVNLVWVVLTIASIVYAAQANQIEPYLPTWLGIVIVCGLFATAWALAVHYALGEQWQYDPYADLTEQVKLKDY